MLCNICLKTAAVCAFVTHSAFVYVWILVESIKEKSLSLQLLSVGIYYVRNYFIFQLFFGNL